MRIVKEAEERKNEILDTAERLFISKGYDNTSTNDILNEIGIARGTLYYHFKSKAEILDAIIERLTGSLVSKVSEIYEKKEIPVLQRLTMMILALNIEDQIENEFMDQVHKPQNALLHQKMQERLLNSMIPLFAALIEEGIEAKICSTNWPFETAEMTFLYSITVFDELNKLNPEEKNQKILAFIYNLERLLGMHEGTMLSAVLPVLQKSTHPESGDSQSLISESGN